MRLQHSLLATAESNKEVYYQAVKLSFLNVRKYNASRLQNTEINKFIVILTTSLSVTFSHDSISSIGLRIKKLENHLNA